MRKRIDEMASQLRGVSYQPSDVREEGRGVPILRANNIAAGAINFDDLVYVDEKCIKKQQYLISGDIVICASSGSKALVGKAGTYQSQMRVSFGAFCKVLRPNDLLLGKYLGHFFQSPRYRNLIASKSRGSNINNLRSDDIDSIEIDMPALNVIAQIVAELDSIKAALRAKHLQLDQLDEAIKSRFIERRARA